MLFESAGVKNEAKVLKEMGLIKNTKKQKITLNNIEKGVIPDAETGDFIYEIKDVKYLTNTDQIKRLRQHAKESNKTFTLIIGEKTKIASSLEDDIIIRRTDIGPQNK